ncbi:MAG: peptidoglycan-associated lipoprotein Pal [Pseudomonadota bacterium]
MHGTLRFPLLLVAALGLGACTSPDRFGGTGADDASALGLNGAAGDPSSPAFFQSSVGDRVLFPVDQSTLTEEAKVVLTGQARWLNSNTTYSAIVEGHADEQGTREYNLALGARRANAVQEYLISQGVAGTRLQTISYGKERPLEICSQEACYANNRRAVTLLQAAGGS